MPFSASLKEHSWPRDDDAARFVTAVPVPKRTMVGTSRYLRSWTGGIATVLLIGAIQLSWLSIYRILPSGDAATVARGISEAVLPNILGPIAALPFGIALELGLSMAAGLAIACAVRILWPRATPWVFEAAVILVLLAAMWSANFLLILPEINPGFTGPFSNAASIIYNVFFGGASALILRFYDGYRFDPDQSTELDY